MGERKLDAGPAEVDSALGVADPRDVLDGEVGGWDAELDFSMVRERGFDGDWYKCANRPLLIRDQSRSRLDHACAAGMEAPDRWEIRLSCLGGRRDALSLCLCGFCRGRVGGLSSRYAGVEKGRDGEGGSY